MLLAEAPWRLRCCWQDAAGKEDARLHREDVAGRGAVAERHRETVAGRGTVAAEMLLSRTLLAEKTQGCIGKMLLAGGA